jgi:tetratricopeptide (TPR) repeat protein
LARAAERLSRKELKQRDPLATAAAPLTEGLERNWKRILVVLGVAAVVVVVVSVASAVAGRKHERAADLLGLVLAEADKPVVGTPALPEADPKQKPSDYFNTEQDKDQAVASKATSVAVSYPGTPSAQTTLIVEGDALYRLGKYPEALQSYDAFLKGTDSQNLFRAYAMLGKAYALLGQGKTDDAIAAAKDLADHSPSGFGRDLGLLAEGRFYEQAGQLAQARQAYGTLKIDFAETAAGREASERLGFLGEAPAMAPATRAPPAAGKP